jgi:hypothetical protein
MRPLIPALRTSNECRGRRLRPPSVSTPDGLYGRGRSRICLFAGSLARWLAGSLARWLAPSITMHLVVHVVVRVVVNAPSLSETIFSASLFLFSLSLSLSSAFLSLFSLSLLLRHLAADQAALAIELHQSNQKDGTHERTWRRTRPPSLSTQRARTSSAPAAPGRSALLASTSSGTCRPEPRRVPTEAGIRGRGRAAAGIALIGQHQQRHLPAGADRG